MTSNENVSLNKNLGGKILSILTIPDIAPAGFQTGTIIDLVLVEGKDEKGDPYKTLKLTGELDAVDKTGQKFKVEKNYNMLENGRGKAYFLSDASCVAGKKLTEHDLVEFDTNTMIGQKVQYEVKHTKKNKTWSASVGTLKPAVIAETTTTTQ